MKVINWIICFFPKLKAGWPYTKYSLLRDNLSIPGMGRKGPKHPRPFTIWALKHEAALINQAKERNSLAQCFACKEQNLIESSTIKLSVLNSYIGVKNQHINSHIWTGLAYKDFFGGGGGGVFSVVLFLIFKNLYLQSALWNQVSFYNNLLYYRILLFKFLAKHLLTYINIYTVNVI